MTVLTAAAARELERRRAAIGVLLSANENGTLAAIEHLEHDGGVFARDLARELGIGHTAALMRLERLRDAGFLTRRSVRLVEGGGRAWRYALSRDSLKGVLT